MSKKNPAIKGSFNCCQLSAVGNWPELRLTAHDRRYIDDRVYLWRGNAIAVLLLREQRGSLEYLKKNHKFKEIARFPSSFDDTLVIIFRPASGYRIRKVHKPNRWTRNGYSY